MTMTNVRGFPFRLGQSDIIRVVLGGVQTLVPKSLYIIRLYADFQCALCR
jgi:hypothetical protein